MVVCASHVVYLQESVLAPGLKFWQIFQPRKYLHNLRTLIFES